MSTAIERYENKDANESMNKVREFRSTVNFFDILNTIVILFLATVGAVFGFKSGNFALTSFSLIGGVVLYVMKVLFFGMAHTAIAIALNTEAK